MQKTLTTGQVGKLIGESLQNVIVRYERGEFPGAYRYGKNTNRRFPPTSVIAFLKRHERPIPQELLELANGKEVSQ